MNIPTGVGEALLHSASDAIIATDREGRITFWNQGAGIHNACARMNEGQFNGQFKHMTEGQHRERTIFRLYIDDGYRRGCVTRDIAMT